MEELLAGTASKDNKIFELETLSDRLSEPKFDKIKHDSQSRLLITSLFLKSYFLLIAGTFVFTGIYNFLAAYFNYKFSMNMSYLEVTNTVSIITTTLSSGVGFVIGYYFKNKGDKD